MQKVEEFVTQNKEKLIIGGVTVGVLALAISLLKGKKTENVPVQNTSQQQLPEQTSQPEYLQIQNKEGQQIEEEHEEKAKHARTHHKKPNHQEVQIDQQVEQKQEEPQVKSREQILQEIVEQIEVKYIGQTSTLDLSTISSVLEHSIELAEEPYINLTKSNRRERRTVMRTDSQKYEELILNYNEQVEKVLIDAQEEMLAALKIEKELFEESVLQLMERGLYQQMYMLQAAIRQKIKEKIPASRKVTMEETKKVIQFQVKVLKENPDFFKTIITKLQSDMETANMIPTVLNTMLQDLIYEEFQIEEEDQMKNMMGNEVLSDPEIHELLMQIEEAMFNLMGSMGMGGGMGGGMM